MDDIKDVKPLVRVPLDLADFKGGFIILAACILVALAVFFYLRWRKRPAAPSIPVPTIPPWDLALRQLTDLSLKQYPEKGMFKVFYITLSDIVRHYLENRFTIKAPEMTTEEFLNFAKGSAVLSERHKDILRDFLSGGDMVKFAKHQPSVNEAKTHFDCIKKLIEETKSTEPAA